MELLVIWHDHRDDLEAWALTHFGVIRLPTKPSLVKVGVEVVSVVFVTIGIVGELKIGVKITSINGISRSKSATLRRQSDQLLALVTQVASEAESHAAEVEESVAPRRLTASQRASIKSKLSRFVGQAFGAWHDTFDLESSVFARELVSALNDNARWKAKPNFNVGGSVSMFTVAPEIPDTGILISATNDDASQQASEALIRELMNNGFNCSRGEEFVKGDTTPGTAPFIYIHVLARPEGPQGDAKVQAEAKTNRTSGPKNPP